MWYSKNTICYAAIAQWIEHWSSEPGVGGSNPFGSAYCVYSFPHLASSTSNKPFKNTPTRGKRYSKATAMGGCPLRRD